MKPNSQKRQAVQARARKARKLRGWTPFKGPQTDAFLADGKVDTVGYGGAGGGGKTDLELGLALLKHRRTIIYRRTFPQLAGAIERSREIYEGRGKYNETQHAWRVTTKHDIAGRPTKAIRRYIQFGSMQRLQNREDWRGNPFDLRAFDEAQNFLKEQIAFTMAWTRTNVPGQHTLDLLCFNPPTTPEGLWLIDYFAPWLDVKHADPALPGEVRWFITKPDGEEKEVPGPRDYKSADYARPEPITIVDDKGDVRTLIPRSRTFFPARVKDNPVYMATGYMAVLDALPEPLRSQMRDGDFTAGLQDDAWQVIPTLWVRLAMARWKAQPTRPLDAQGKPLELTALGGDIAAGGIDKTVFAPVYVYWFAPLKVWPGAQTPNGAAAAAKMVESMDGEKCVPNIDAIGIGQGLVTACDMLGIKFNGINASGSSYARDKSGLLKMANKRAEMYWKLREDLDPESGKNLCLPDDRELLADLCAARYTVGSNGIQIEAKDDGTKNCIKARLGRSPDKGEAVLLANYIAPVGGFAGKTV